jgi:hypothetical protein
VPQHIIVPNNGTATYRIVPNDGTETYIVPNIYCSNCTAVYKTVKKGLNLQ